MGHKESMDPGGMEDRCHCLPTVPFLLADCPPVGPLLPLAEGPSSLSPHVCPPSSSVSPTSQMWSCSPSAPGNLLSACPYLPSIPGSFCRTVLDASGGNGPRAPSVARVLGGRDCVLLPEGMGHPDPSKRILSRDVGHGAVD